MKKSAIILTLCMTAILVGCGKVETDSADINPLDIQKVTGNVTASKNPELEIPSEFQTETTAENEQSTENTATTVTTVSGNISGSVTSTTETRTAAVNLVRRTTVAVPNIAPSRGTVRIPVASVPTKTTVQTVKTNVTGKNTTTGSGVSTSTTTESISSTTNETHPSNVTNGDIICSVLEKGVEITRNGKIVQLIEVDTEQMLDFYADGIINVSTLINIHDFDFDGYDDLFIPQEIGALNTFGIYMHYNPKTEAFEEWAEMTDISVYSWTEDDQTLHTYIKDSDFENESRTYVWNAEKQLVIISSKIQYQFDDKPENQYNIYIDYFEYPDNTETLVKREKLLFNENLEIVGTEEISLNEPTTEPPTTEPPTEETTTEKEET